MGKADLRTNGYLDDNRRYADLFNGSIFGGKQFIHPEELEDVSAELFYLEGEKDEAVIPDKVKKWKGIYTAVLITENQTYVDYQMVIRNMHAESNAYHKQWNEKRLQHERDKDLRDRNEFLSRIRKNEKFIPVIVLVIYYGTEKPWDGAKTLYELIDFGDDAEFLKPFVNNYRMNLYDFHAQNDFDTFKTELKTLFEFLRYSKDKTELVKRMNADKERYSHVDCDTSRLLGVLTNVNELEHYNQVNQEGKEECNMCQAFEDMKEEGRLEGQLEGRREERCLSNIQIIRRLKNRNKPLEEITDITGLEETYIIGILDLLNQLPDEDDNSLVQQLLAAGTL